MYCIIYDYYYLPSIASFGVLNPNPTFIQNRVSPADPPPLLPLPRPPLPALTTLVANTRLPAA